VGECEPEFRIRPCPGLRSDNIRLLKSGSRGVGDTRKMFRLGAAAEQDTKAHPNASCTPHAVCATGMLRSS
jgi:hypothetical protein